MLFLATAGMTAGEHLVPVIMEKGPKLVFTSVVVTLVPLIVAWFAARFMLVPTLSSLGLICGAMTSTPGLGAVTASVDSQAPAVAYAAVYPAALIGVTIISQILAIVLSAIASAPPPL
jgi:putative transport protein